MRLSEAPLFLFPQRLSLISSLLFNNYESRPLAESEVIRLCPALEARVEEEQDEEEVVVKADGSSTRRKSS